MGTELCRSPLDAAALRVGGVGVVRGLEGAPSLVTPELPGTGPGLAGCSTTFLLFENPLYLLHKH